MSATLLAEPVELRSRLTLGQVLARAQEDVHLHGLAECPVCGGDLTQHDVEAHCDDCGSRLS